MIYPMNKNRIAGLNTIDEIVNGTVCWYRNRLSASRGVCYGSRRSERYGGDRHSPLLKYRNRGTTQIRRYKCCS